MLSKSEFNNLRPYTVYMCRNKKNHSFSSNQVGALKYYSENLHWLMHKHIFLYAQIAYVIYIIENGHRACTSAINDIKAYHWHDIRVRSMQWGKVSSHVSCPHTIPRLIQSVDKPRIKRNEKNLQWQLSGSELAMTEVGFENLQCLSVGIGCNEIRRPSELCGGPGRLFSKLVPGYR